MTDYNGWDKAALIARIHELELISEATSSGASRDAIALRESEERLRAILETAVTTTDGTLTQSTTDVPPAATTDPAAPTATDGSANPPAQQ